MNTTLMIVGLGNPGERYAATRHNAGILFAERLLTRHDVHEDFRHEKKLHADIARIPADHDRPAIIVVRPTTFMNRSGNAVHATSAYYKIPLDNLIIAHDDLDLALGTYKISHNVRSAGHNGVQHIIDTLGTQNFTRIRIGVEHADGRRARGPIPGDDFVLQKMSADDYAMLLETIDIIIRDVHEQKHVAAKAATCE